MLSIKKIIIVGCLLVLSVVGLVAQVTQPAPGAPRAASVPAVKEKKLANGLTVAVIEKPAVPIVTIQLVIKAGAGAEDAAKAGLANMTADMLSKGTTTKTATQIAEAVEFLGGSINTGAGWNSSFVSITVTSDKVDQAMAILADVVLHPKFDQKELDLLKTQSLDGLTYSLKQPSFLANYVASKYTYGEHPAGGTPASISSITREDILRFKSEHYLTTYAVLIFTGDISSAAASRAASKAFSTWKKPAPVEQDPLTGGVGPQMATGEVLQRILVVDLPKSGQAAVSYSTKLADGRVMCPRPYKCEVENGYYPALVFNSVLGGGYSSRLNLEIRIKRGLSYGAGSSIAWRWSAANFATRAQTKNESAPEVAELILAEIKKMKQELIPADELTPRKAVLIGNFGRGLETTNGLASAIGDLLVFDLAPSVLNSYVVDVNNAPATQIRDFAAKNILNGDIIIVGDYSIFKDDLARRFPNLRIDVIKAADLDLSKDNLRK